MMILIVGYFSSVNPFQVYYRVRQLTLLQSAMVCYYKVRQLFFITKCAKCYYEVRQVLQSATEHPFQVYYKVQQVLLQSVTAYFITKCDGLLLQSAIDLTKCNNFITKCDRTDGSGTGCLELESRVKFPYLHETCYLLELFHRSRD